jgi:hypothetical protein
MRPTNRFINQYFEDSTNDPEQENRRTGNLIDAQNAKGLLTDFTSR